VALAVFVLTATPGFAQGGPDPSFGAFWRAFQQAVRSNDIGAINGMTRFPLPVHGQTDADRVRRVNEKQTAAQLPKWLAQDSGLSEQPETMRALILRMDAAGIVSRGPNRGVTERSVRLGSFLFEREADRWRLTRVYEER